VSRPTRCLRSRASNVRSRRMLLSNTYYAERILQIVSATLLHSYRSRRRDIHDSYKQFNVSHGIVFELRLIRRIGFVVPSLRRPVYIYIYCALSNIVAVFLIIAAGRSDVGVLYYGRYVVLIKIAEFRNVYDLWPSELSAYFLL